MYSIKISLGKPYHGENKSIRYLVFVLWNEEMQWEENIEVVKTIDCPTPMDRFSMRKADFAISTEDAEKLLASGQARVIEE